MSTKRAALLLGIVALARLVSLAYYPLMDATEARYANIARVMVETGDWITLQTAPGTFFWAKPPLWAWASSASMWLFGVSEFGARFPSFVFASLTVLVAYRWARDIASGTGLSRPRETGALAAIVLATCLGFFINAGAVMTDAALVFATTWALAAFWSATEGADADPRRRFGFFAALGIGLLAKGPVAVVLVAVPVAAWCVLQDRWTALRSLPWFRGAALSAAIAVPWYLAAEWKTPGFLEYFLLGENFYRFLVPGWKGDQYGFPHAAPHGIVWLYFVLAALPWSVVAIPAAVTASWGRWRRSFLDPSISYVALVALVPLVFFSISSNLIWTYALPGLPAFAVLMGVWLTRSAARSRLLRFATIGSSAASIALAGGAVAEASRLASNYSTFPLYEAWASAQATAPGPLVFEQRSVVSSLCFYSDGFALSEASEDDESATHYDVYTHHQIAGFASQPPECDHARAVVAQTRDFVLVRETGLPKYCDADEPAPKEP